MKVSFCVGIDIAKDKFDVCIKEQKSDGRSVVKGSRSFSNAEAGLKSWEFGLRNVRGRFPLCCL